MYVRISRVIYAMPAKSAPPAGHILHRGTVAGAGVANPGAAGSIAANGVGNPVVRCLTPPPWKAAAWLSMDDRFKRIGEAADAFVGQGSFGDVFLGFDELKNEHVIIKRQRIETDQAAKETA